MDNREEMANAIMETAINAAWAISKIFSEPVANTQLLQKRLFPNRSIPHVKKARLKKEAREMLDSRAARGAATTASYVVQTAIQASQPIPEYPEGKQAEDFYSKSMVGEKAAELFIGRDGKALIDDRSTFIRPELGMPFNKQNPTTD